MVIPAILQSVPEVVETERLTLRCPRAGDGVEVNAAVIESLPELRLWMSWAKDPMPIEITEANLREAAADFILRKSMSYLIFLKGNATLVGGANLHSPNWDVPSFEIGYFVRTRLTGHGYITEAVIALTQMAFTQLGARRVQLICNSTNTRSAAVARRAGYQLEGIICNDRRHHLTGELVDAMVFARVR